MNLHILRLMNLGGKPALRNITNRYHRLGIGKTENASPGALNR